MKNRKTVMTLTVMTIGIVLLSKNIKLNNTISVKEAEVELLQNKNKSLEIEIERYESIYNAINNIDLNKNEYTYYDIPLTVSQQEYIQQLCWKYNFSYELILGIIYAESKFDLNAISYDGSSMGIMEVQDRYSKYYADIIGLDNYNLFNFEDNMLLGITNLIVARNFWINEGYTNQESLTMLIVGSYNKGNMGMKNYYKQTGSYITNYTEIILNYKCELEQQQIN